MRTQIKITGGTGGKGGFSMKGRGEVSRFFFVLLLLGNAALYALAVNTQ